MAGLKAVLAMPFTALLAARGTLFPWLAVFLAVGISIWFALPYEPGALFYGLAFGGYGGAALAYLRGPEVLQPLSAVVVAVLAGVLAAGIRAHSVTAPMLEFRFYGAVQGRVIEIDRSQTDALRILLDQVVLEDVAPARTPLKVRISLRGKGVTPTPGQVVMLTAFLSAPEAAAEPGGFDFRRMAFFDQLGAVGYTRSPVMLWQEPQAGTQEINRLRTRLSNAIMAAVPGDAGAFSSGVMTGDRSGISLETVQALRDSNLAHLLAISGMNMAFLTGFVFFLVRYGVALVPPLALRINSKKIAAVVAFGVALFYLLLSGANVATERAFLIVCVMLGAVLLDRRALSLRTVALAGITLMLTEPESLAEPGFQLSFAATVVLIAGYGALSRGVMAQKVPRWMMPVFTLVLTSVLAGLATAPFAAAHFNRFTDYGLLANLLTVPMMSLLMGAGALAALLAPIGLAWPALWVMEQSARWILFIAHWVAGLDGAVTGVPSPGVWVMPVLVLGALWVILWQGKLRVLGAVPMAVALALWVVSPRPIALISSDGALVGVMGPEGRVLSGAKGAGVAAQSWLENDGDLAGQEVAAARAGFDGPRGVRRFEIGGFTGVVLSGKAGLAALSSSCNQADFVILAASQMAESPPSGCLLIDRKVLQETGAIEISLQAGALHLHPVRDAPRLWRGPRPVHAEMVLKAPKGAQLARQ